MLETALVKVDRTDGDDGFVTSINMTRCPFTSPTSLRFANQSLYIHDAVQDVMLSLHLLINAGGASYSHRQEIAKPLRRGQLETARSLHLIPTLLQN